MNRKTPPFSSAKASGSNDVIGIWVPSIVRLSFHELPPFSERLSPCGGKTVVRNSGFSSSQFQPQHEEKTLSLA